MFTVLEKRKKKTILLYIALGKCHAADTSVNENYHSGLSFLLTEFHNAITIENVLKQFFQVIQLSDKSV